MRTLLMQLAVAGAAFVAGTANADVIFSAGNIPGDTENVLFDADCDGNITGPAATIQGCLNQTRSQLVDLTTTGDSLDTQGVGQAQLIAEDGSFDDLLIEFASGETFNHLIFNIDVLNGEGDGTATFTASLVGEPDFTETFDLDANGQNFFTVQAINGEFMTSFLIESSVQLENVNQIRIGAADGGGGGIPVPEPTAIGLFGLGLVAVALGRRRKAA